MHVPPLEKNVKMNGQPEHICTFADVRNRIGLRDGWIILTCYKCRQDSKTRYRA